MPSSFMTHYESLSPHLYQVIERLELVQDASTLPKPSDVSLILTLRQREPSCEKRLVLTCTGIRNFRFEPSVYPWALTDFQITDISQWQWEAIGFQVGNNEQDTGFAFYCDDISAIVTES